MKNMINKHLECLPSSLFKILIKNIHLNAFLPPEPIFHLLFKNMMFFRESLNPSLNCVVCEFGIFKVLVMPRYCL